MVNVWNSYIFLVGGLDNSSVYLGVNVGLLWDGWLLKYIGNLNWQQQQGKVYWNSNQIYFQCFILQFNFIVSGGQIFINGEFFDIIGLCGVNFFIDDNMFLDGMCLYVLEICGVVQSNVFVIVCQGSNIIYQIIVLFGLFILQDVYFFGYGSDFEVLVKEVDGLVEVFSVFYVFVVQLLCLGMICYVFFVGKVDDSVLCNKLMFYQVIWQYGINNLLIGYIGVIGFDDYQVFLVGIGMNIGIGVFFFDVIYLWLKSDVYDDLGQSYCVIFNCMFIDIQISIVLVVYCYLMKGYYNFNDVLYVVDQEKNSCSNYILWW